MYSGSKYGILPERAAYEAPVIQIWDEGGEGILCESDFENIDIVDLDW